MQYVYHNLKYDCYFIIYTQKKKNILHNEITVIAAILWFSNIKNTKQNMCGCVTLKS